MLTPRKGERIALIGFACFAFAWAVVRASVQAVTGDEAANYLFFSAGNDTAQWTASATNHLLNTLLVRLSTSVLGLSPLTLRLPALTGAAIYIYVAYRLSGIVSTEWPVRFPTLICLVYNPLVFDFFVAARGYGLANAFLLGAVALSFSGRSPGGEPKRLIAASAASSALLALSFSANFAFAFVDAAALLLIHGRALRAAGNDPPLRRKLIAANILPGLVTILLLPSWTLLHWRDIMIVAGTTSLRDTLNSLVHASMYRPNGYLLNPLLWALFEKLRRFVLPLTGAFVVAQFGWIVAERPWHRADKASCRSLAALVGAIVALTLAAHILAYWLFHLLLPVGRTAIFFIPLFMLLAGTAAAIPIASRAGRVCQNALVGMLFVLSLYHLFSLRLTYFEEWEYQADMKQGYAVAACYNHERGIQKVEVSWYYDSGMNFYRILSGRETFEPFSYTTPHPTDRSMYVLHGEFEKSFIESQGLAVVFRGNSGMVVAVRPQLADPPGGACYSWSSS